MRLVSLGRAAGSDPGVYFGDEILNLAGARIAVQVAALIPPTLRGLLEAGPEALDLVKRILDKVDSGHGVADRLRQAKILVPGSSAPLVAPLPDTSLILSVGQNYKGHLKEMGNKLPVRANAFNKNVASVIGPGEPIILPPDHPDMVDWEGEFSFVIGTPCHKVSAADAFKYIAGYTLINDVSARNWAGLARDKMGAEAVRAWDENRLGKQFPTFCPMGPTIATADEVGDVDNLNYTTSLNGEVMQDAHTNDLVFGVAALVERFSEFYLLRPGDVISTGAPSGVGFGRNPKIFMKAGDTITVQAPGVGALANPIVAASAN